MFIVFLSPSSPLEGKPWEIRRHDAYVVHLVPETVPATESVLNICVLNKTLGPKILWASMDVSWLWNNLPEPSKKGRRVEGSEEFLTHSGNILQALERKQG